MEADEIALSWDDGPLVNRLVTVEPGGERSGERVGRGPGRVKLCCNAFRGTELGRENGLTLERARGVARKVVG